jgi:hypothetical protein
VISISGSACSDVSANAGALGSNATANARRDNFIRINPQKVSAFEEGRNKRKGTRPRLTVLPSATPVESARPVSGLSTRTALAFPCEAQWQLSGAVILRSRAITVAGAAPALLYERTGFPFSADLLVAHLGG